MKVQALSIIAILILSLGCKREGLTIITDGAANWEKTFPHLQPLQPGDGTVTLSPTVVCKTKTGTIVDDSLCDSTTKENYFGQETFKSPPGNYLHLTGGSTGNQFGTLYFLHEGVSKDVIYSGVAGDGFSILRENVCENSSHAFYLDQCEPISNFSWRYNAPSAPALSVGAGEVIIYPYLECLRLETVVYDSVCQMHLPHNYDMSPKTFRSPAGPFHLLNNSDGSHLYGNYYNLPEGYDSNQLTRAGVTLSQLIAEGVSLIEENRCADFTSRFFVLGKCHLKTDLNWAYVPPPISLAPGDGIVSAPNTAICRVTDKQINETYCGGIPKDPSKATTELISPAGYRYVTPIAEFPLIPGGQYLFAAGEFYVHANLENKPLVTGSHVCYHPTARLIQSKCIRPIVIENHASGDADLLPSYRDGYPSSKVYNGTAPLFSATPMSYNIGDSVGSFLGYRYSYTEGSQTYEYDASIMTLDTGSGATVQALMGIVSSAQPPTEISYYPSSIQIGGVRFCHANPSGTTTSYGFYSIKSVKSYGDYQITNTNYAFADCAGLKSIGDLVPARTANAGMVGMFRNAHLHGSVQLASLGNNLATNLNEMFYGTKLAVVYPESNISAYNTSNVQSMDMMFKYAQMSQDLSGWDTGNVQSMSYMFQGSLFNINLIGWNVSKVTNYLGFANSYLTAPLFGSP